MAVTVRSVMRATGQSEPLFKAMLSDGGSDSTEAVMKAARSATDRLTSSSNEPSAWNPDYSDGRVAKPRVEPAEIMALVRRHPRLAACLHLLATAAFGLGGSIKSRANEEESPKGLEPETLAEIGRISEWFAQCNPVEGWQHTKIALGHDVVHLGNGYLEIRRASSTDEHTPATEPLAEDLARLFMFSALGAPRRAFHLRADTMRVRGDGDGYLQRLRAGGVEHVTHFKRFGDPRVMRKKDGAFVKPDEEQIPLAEQATEIIHFKIYDSQDAFYGGPWFLAGQAAHANVHAAGLRLGNQLMRSPGWPYVVMTHGLQDKTFKQTAGAIHGQNKGLESAGRPLIANVPRVATAAGGGATTVSALPPGLGEAESLLNVLKRGDDVFRELSGALPELFLGPAAAATRSGAMAARQIAGELAFGPLARLFDSRIDETLMYWLGAERTAYESQLPAITDPVQESQILARQGRGLLSADAAIAQINRLIPTANLRAFGGVVGRAPWAVVEKVVDAVMRERLVRSSAAAAPGADEPADEPADAQKTLGDEIKDRLAEIEAQLDELAPDA